MFKTLALVVLCLLCLVSVNDAAPTDSSSEESSEDTKNLVEKYKLILAAVIEFQEMHDDILERGPKIFYEVLKDPKVVEVKTPTMEKETKILRDYLDKFEKAKKEHKKEHVFDLVDEYDDVLNKFNSKFNDLTPEGEIIRNSLEEHGLDEIPKAIRAHFDKFLVKFNSEAEAHIAKLSEKEKEDEKRFIEWYGKMKAEKDTDTKIVMFDDFFDVDD